MHCWTQLFICVINTFKQYSTRNIIYCNVVCVLSCSIMSDALQPHRLQHARLPCPSKSPGACSNSCLLNWLSRPTISSSVSPFSSCLQSFPASGALLMSWHLASGGISSLHQRIGDSASIPVLLMSIQDWFPL